MNRFVVGGAIVVSFLLGAASLKLVAQQTVPAQIDGCIYNSSLPTLSNGQASLWQCDVNGKVLVK